MIKTIIAIIVISVIAIQSDKIIRSLKLKISNKQFMIIIFAAYLILDFILF